MTPKTCIAVADTPRAIVALLAPIALLATVFFTFASKGYDLLDYPSLLVSGELSWIDQGIGWLALGIWIVRYFPPAWAALWDGPCLVFADDQNLYLPRSKTLRLEDIKAVTVHRGFARKVALVDTKDGRLSVPLLFIRPSSDRLLLSLSPEA